MSRALAVFYGRFGRATVYQLNRPFNTHAHREGHLTFHVGGMSASINVSDERRHLTEDSVVAVNPWEPHSFTPSDCSNGGMFLEHASTELNHARRPGFCFSMIFSENRRPLFRIMLQCSMSMPNGLPRTRRVLTGCVSAVSGFKRTAALDQHIRRAANLICGTPSLSNLDCEF